MADVKNNAIANVRAYLGKYAGIFAALVWISSFLLWYALQNEGASRAIGGLYQDYNPWVIGIILGLASALISIGGIKVIKKICVLGLPLLFAFAIYTILISKNSIPLIGSWGFSFSAILAIILIWLPFSVNLPTLFRHSKSKSDSILGLALKTILLIFFQIFTVLTNIDNTTSLTLLNTDTTVTFNTLFVSLFVILAYLCVNLMNIYFASAGWETLFPKHQGPFEYLFVGLLGTLLFCLFHVFQSTHLFSYSMDLIEEMLTSFIANLGVVLLISLITKLVVRHRPRKLEKISSALCWILGCIATVIFLIQNPTRLPGDVTLSSIIASSITFLVIIFVEETIFAFDTLTGKENNLFRH